MPTRLSPDQLSALADLERRVVAADGGRLKLEWESLRAGRADVLLEQAHGRLVGFAGLYRFGAGVEVTGMVDPEVRRRGLGGALLTAALDLADGPVLLVAPRESIGARRLAEARGGVLDHSEHALVLTGEPTAGPTDPRLALRPAVASDAPALGRLLASAFGHADEELSDRTLVVERDGVTVGSVRLTLDGDRGGVYGFVVDPELRGRGIGRDVLGRVCRSLRADGATCVGLDVEVDNDRALGLYTSVGFTRVTTEDYWALPAA